jgi:16S rRNA (guanine527-N7)-methyltransferase
VTERVSRETGLPDPPAALDAVFGRHVDGVVRYAHLLASAGVTRGVIGPREVPRLWDRHILGSAAVREVIPPDAAVADIGSGAGLPGVPLALARPDLDVTLVEPMQRRVDFLCEVVTILGLDVRILRARAQDIPPGSFEVVVARAVAPLARLLPMVWDVVTPGGSVVALKGQRAAAEVDAAAAVLARLGAPDADVREVGYGPAATRVVVVAKDGS